MFKLFGIEFLDNFFFAFYYIRILLMEALKTTFVLEQHLQKSTPPFQHFVQSVLKTSLKGAQLLLRLACSFCVLTTLVLGVPDVVSDEFLNFLLLLL